MGIFKIQRCPYCGSTDVYSGPFETYCADCGESWPNEIDEESQGELDFLISSKKTSKVMRSLSSEKAPIIRVGLGGLVFLKGGKIMSEIVKHIIF